VPRLLEMTLNRSRFCGLVGVALSLNGKIWSLVFYIWPRELLTLHASDRLAEFDLPRSGIEPLADGMTFPSWGNPPDVGVLSYLAEISIRGLLNRVRNSLYNGRKTRASNSNASTGSLVNANPVDMPISAMVSICFELNHQLGTWYQSIPEIVRPPLGLEPLQHERQKILRIRFYAAKHIIHRPFVLHVVSNPEEIPSALIMENCQKCLESCRLYLQNSGGILQRHSQYT
jgi:hypothetical protein